MTYAELKTGQYFWLYGGYLCLKMDGGFREFGHSDPTGFRFYPQSVLNNMEDYPHEKVTLANEGELDLLKAQGV